MNFRKRASALPQFQMTAMMDIVFLLLCFFITSSVFSQWENEVNITLPAAKSGQSSTRLPGEIILNVAKDGSVTVNQRVFRGDELESLLVKVAGYLPGQPVIVRADKETPYGNVMRVMDACRSVGISELAFATLDETPSGAPAKAPALPPPPTR